MSCRRPQIKPQSKLTRRYWTGFAVLFLVGAAVARWVVPRLIVDAYNEESLGFLNDVLAGRALHPVEYYLEAWTRTLPVALLALIAVGVAGHLLLANRSQIIPGLKRFWGGDRVTPGVFLWSALLIGALVGIAEGGDLGVRRLLGWVTHPSQFTWQLVWMPPLAAPLGFAALSAVAIAVARLALRSRWRGVPIQPAVFGLVGLGAYGLLSQPRFHLTGYATIILALGLAAAAGRLATRRSDSLSRFNRLATIPLVLVLAISTAIAFAYTPSRVERRAMAGLPDAEPGAPNVLLIILDTVRTRNMGLYGYERPTTPSIDAWALSGTTFDMAISTAPWTLPSHASLFTGRIPQELSTDFDQALDDTYPTIAEVLSRSGYATAGFVANYSYTTAASGIERGFARYEDYPMSWGRLLKSSWLTNVLARPILSRLSRGWSWQTLQWWGGGGKAAETVSSDFLAWLEDREDRPFFAFLNYFDAHEPYDSPAEFESRFMPPGARKDFRKRQDIEPRDLVGTVGAYDAGIAYIDQEIGRVLARLEADGSLANTLVIITSDHGEQFAEHGLMGHGNSLYMPTLHVPLVVGFRGAPAGARIATPVSLRDLPATIFDLLGIEPDVEFPGASLARYWNGSAATPGPIVSAVTTRPDVRPWEPTYEGPISSVLLDGLHYIRNPDGREELYDLATDPGQLRDLSGSVADAGELPRLRAALDRALADAPDRWLIPARLPGSGDPTRPIAAGANGG